MKIKFLIPVLLLVVTSCAKVYFASPQPVNGKVIKTFSPQIIGFYSDSSLDVRITADSLWVNNEGYRLNSEIPDSSSVLVKFYKDFYFASFKEDTNFDVYMANFYEDKLALYMLNGDERSVDILKRFVEVKVIDKEEESYLINPSKKEFNDIIEWEVFDLVAILKKLE